MPRVKKRKKNRKKNRKWGRKNPEEESGIGKGGSRIAASKKSLPQ
jgi:hypothetical protein